MPFTWCSRASWRVTYGLGQITYSLALFSLWLEAKGLFKNVFDFPWKKRKEKLSKLIKFRCNGQISYHFCRRDNIVEVLMLHNVYDTSGWKERKEFDFLNHTTKTHDMNIFSSLFDFFANFPCKECLEGMDGKERVGLSRWRARGYQLAFDISIKLKSHQFLKL